MLIHPKIHEGREPTILAMQARGWLFESHYWVDGPYPRKCQWCGQAATGDMEMENRLDPTLCPGNPATKDLVTALHELADILFNHIMHGEKLDVDFLTLQPASAVLKQHGIRLGEKEEP